MNPRILFFAALSFCACVPAANAAKAAPAAQPAAVEIVPAAGEYVVLMSEATAKKKDWKSAADKFLRRYKGVRVLWKGGDVETARDALKKANPRYVAVIAAPEEIDRIFVSKLHRLSREMNDDVYGDFLWGIVTGKDGATAATLLAKDQPLILDRAIGTTNFNQQRFKKSFFITDWGAREFVETKDGVSSEKQNAPAGTEMINLFAERWQEVRPQFVISSSHATQFNLEMPFSEGALVPGVTDFYLVEKPLLSRFAQCLGSKNIAQATLDFEKSQKLKKLPKTPDEKVWIAAGNCLFGDALRSPCSMAVTAISAANVKQLVGYTVPSWFGKGGWGTSEKFFGGHQTTSVGQAWFFNNQLIIDALPAGTAKFSLELKADGMDPVYIPQITGVLRMAGVNLPPSQARNELLGCFHDRDVVAFYGDPLYRARFNPAAKDAPPWSCLATEKDGRTLFTIKSARGNAVKGDFCLWFPRRRDAGKPLKISRKNLKPTILTENFVIFKDLELAADETLKLSVPVVPAKK